MPIPDLLLPLVGPLTVGALVALAELLGLVAERVQARSA